MNTENQELVEKALEALTGSYSKYSEFSVGAALILEDGTIIKGSNQENAAYTCGICAERVALYYAQASYPTSIVKAIAIVARKNDSDEIEPSISPCGLCRQALLEVETKQQVPIKVLMVGKDDIVVVNSIKDLLPFSFQL